MAQSGYTPISLYYSTTAAAAPSSGNLVAGELALNTVDEKLYFKNSAGTVKLLASNTSSSGTVSSVAMSVPSFLSIAGSPITTSGTLAVTYSGTALPVLNGGTGVTTSTGTGNVVLSNSPTLVTPALGTPASGNLANCTFPTLNQNTTGTAAGLSTTLAVSSGGTGQTSYTDGQLLIGNTTGNTLAKATLTAGTGISITNGSGTISIAATGASGTVTSVAQSFTGGIISVGGSPITSSGTLALTVAGTSGGIPYFTSGTAWATSAALAANAIVLGGGAGVAPATTTTGTGVVTALGVNTGTAGAFVVNGGALGTPSSGTLSSTTVDGTNGVGYINIPQNAQTGSYTLVAGDAGKHIYHAAAAAAATYTIPANASVAYAIGTAVTFINMSTNNVTVSITTDTLYLGGTGTTGSRTLAQYGVATAVKMTSTTWVITGSGLT